MTVSSTTTRNSYTGDGSTTVFAYTFKIFDDDDITVILRTTATGTETVQTKTTHYSVSGVGSAGGGNITFVTAPTAAQTVVLLRQTAQTQTTDYTPNDPFPAASHEDALDKMTLIIQDQQDELDRAIKLSRTNTMTSTEFTVGASDRASKVLAFDTSGELSVTQELGTFRGNWSASTAFAERDLIKDTTNNNIYLANTAHTSSGSLPISTNADSSKWDLIVDAAAATTSATNAATSATAAAASATAAAASEAAAATSETNAAASEAGVAADAAAAAASASSASTSATNAATSETNAATSASAASTSASNAATSATSASNSATSASTSASNAATSATNASNSASAASTSASNAATSETNAATSESNAATSASSAASDASAAASSAAAAAASFDAFDDIYLGAKASAPTVDNDGDALTAGDQYFNTTNSTLYVWNGSAWQSASPDIVADTTPQLGGNLDTNGNDINFGDNDKAVFGAGSDLQIYHDGSASIVYDNGTGPLNLQTNNSNINIKGGGSASDTMAIFKSTEGVDLYYNNVKKFETTSSGIDVTGTVTADGLDLGAATDAATVSTTASDYQLQLGAADSTTGDIGRNISFDSLGITTASINTIDNGASSSTSLAFFTGNNSALRNRLEIASGGDISFYDSTGVTQGFYWDASTQRLGLGLTNPSRKLHVYSTQQTVAKIEGSGAAAQIDLTGSGGTTSLVNDSGDFYFNVAAAERLRIDVSGNAFMKTANSYIAGTTSLGFYGDAASSNGMFINSGGNVGIGTASVDNKLHLEHAGSLYLQIENTSTANKFYLGNSGGNAILESTGAYSMNFKTNSTEAARIDSSQNFLVATSSYDGSHYNDTSGGGFAVTSAGKIDMKCDGTVANFNRTSTSDGDILYFAKQGTGVGSISAWSSSLLIGTGDVGLAFVDGTPERIQPRKADDQLSADGLIDLGHTSNRFKDLYLSGGVYLGGSGAANYLNDYEEGTWTPTFEAQTTAFTSVTYDPATYGKYVKVGDLVHIQGLIKTDAISGGSGAVLIGGLPFTSSSVTAVSVGYTNAFSGDYPSGGSLLGASTTVSLLYRTSANGALNNVLDVTDLGTGGNDNYIEFSCTYRI